MIDVVIIGRNEARSVDLVIGSIPSSVNIIYVADRCSDDTISRLKRYNNVTVVDTTSHNLNGRQTSYCRNLGLYHTNPNNDVLFLDGDRYIAFGKFGYLQNANTDITLLRLESDYRNDPTFNIDLAYGTMYNGFYSCGILFKRDTINKLVKHKALTRSGIPQLFPEYLQSSWGIEDVSLGDICYDAKLSVSLSPDVWLAGKFERRSLDSIDVVLERCHFRDKLNVKW